MATDLPVSTPAKALDQVADQRVASGEAPTQGAPDLASAAALLNDLGNEFAVLRSDVERLTSSLSDSVHEATQLTLTHTRLYDSAVGVLQEATEEAVAVARQLAQRCIALGKELRGTDLLAERVKRLRGSVDQLEAQVNRVL
ncbi:g7494 [Coccomyxa elongata]